MKQKDFDKLIEPYEEGGTESSPVKRTLGTIVTKLMLSYKHPPEVVGASIYKVFSKMATEGLEFLGDGTYGSKGAELFSCINAQCIDLTKRKLVDETINNIRAMAACTRNDCAMRTDLIVKRSRWERFKWFFTKPRATLNVIYLVSGIFIFIGILLWLYIMGLTQLQSFLLEFIQKLTVLLTGVI